MTSSVQEMDVITKAETRGLIAEVFEETALVLGGLVAMHPVDDDFVWRLVRSLDGVRRKAVRRVNECDVRPWDDAAPAETHPRRHPAIEDFLLELRRS